MLGFMDNMHSKKTRPFGAPTKTAEDEAKFERDFLKCKSFNSAINAIEN